jgi:hypothetical protein
MIEVIHTSEMLVLTRATLHNIPDGILYSRRCENSNLTKINVLYYQSCNKKNTLMNKDSGYHAPNFKTIISPSTNDNSRHYLRHHHHHHHHNTEMRYESWTNN